MLIKQPTNLEGNSNINLSHISNIKLTINICIIIYIMLNNVFRNL